MINFMTYFSWNEFGVMFHDFCATFQLISQQRFVFGRLNFQIHRIVTVRTLVPIV